MDTETNQLESYTCSHMCQKARHIVARHTLNDGTCEKLENDIFAGRIICRDCGWELGSDCR